MSQVLACPLVGFRDLGILLVGCPDFRVQPFRDLEIVSGMCAPGFRVQRLMWDAHPESYAPPTCHQLPSDHVGGEPGPA